MTDGGLVVPVLLGSVRRDRMAARVGAMVMRALTERGHEPVLVDPMDLGLPMLDRMYKEHPKGEAPEPLERLATLYRRADAFVVVSGEYNHGVPAALKNLLDYFLEEYLWRPSGIVCYSQGPFGGVRAAMALRMILAELGMSSVPSLLPIPGVQKVLDEAGGWTGEVPRGVGKFFGEVEWYGRALKAARRGGVPN